MIFKISIESFEAPQGGFKVLKALPLQGIFPVIILGETGLVKRRNPANKVMFIASNAFHVDSKDSGTASYSLHVKT